MYYVGDHVSLLSYCTPAALSPPFLSQNPFRLSKLLRLKVALWTHCCSQANTVCFSVWLIILGHKERFCTFSSSARAHLRREQLLQWMADFILELIMLNPWENRNHVLWLAGGAVRTFSTCKKSYLFEDLIVISIKYRESLCELWIVTQPKLFAFSEGLLIIRVVWLF